MSIVDQWLDKLRKRRLDDAITNLAGLQGDDCAETLLKFLTDPVGSGRAYFLALKLKLVLPPSRLYELLLTADQFVVQDRLAWLISQQDRWERLPYLIKMLNSDNALLRWRIERQLRDLTPAYTKPYPSQLALITRTLSEERIPPDIRKSLEFNLTSLELT